MPSWKIFLANSMPNGMGKDKLEVTEHVTTKFSHDYPQTDTKWIREYGSTAADEHGKDKQVVTNKDGILVEKAF